MSTNANNGLLEFHRRSSTMDILGQLCQQLDLTDTQYAAARSRYEAVGEWLSDSYSQLLQSSVIYAHGSVGLGTAVKPIGRNEFDVDLVCHLPGVRGVQLTPSFVKKLVGDRLREHGTYSKMLEEKPRCWRLNYADEFHLDITPSILNPACASGGELVPDKKLADWKPTHPRGYMSRFQFYSALQPSIRAEYREFVKKIAMDRVEPFPNQSKVKPLLNQIIQLLKRHRDISFLPPDKKDLAPISIVITTLAAWSYAHCAGKRVYEDEFEFMLDVIKCMTNFIQVKNQGIGKIYLIENETTNGENFAEKWNSDPRLASAFYGWHQEAYGVFSEFLNIDGLDVIGKHLSKSFGASHDQIKNAMVSITSGINASRSSNSLFVVPSLGLSTAKAPQSTSIKPNTFFGK